MLLLHRKGALTALLQGLSSNKNPTSIAVGNSKTRWSREGQRQVTAGQMRKHHWCLCSALIVGSFESGNGVAVRLLEMSQWKWNQRRKQLTNELAMHKHRISISHSLKFKWSISANCLQRQQLGLQRLSGFINSCVNENKLPMCEQSDGKQHPVFFSICTSKAAHVLLKLVSRTCS